MKLKQKFAKRLKTYKLRSWLRIVVEHDPALLRLPKEAGFFIEVSKYQKPVQGDRLRMAFIIDKISFERSGLRMYWWFFLKRFSCRINLIPNTLPVLQLIDIQLFVKCTNLKTCFFLLKTSFLIKKEPGHTLFFLSFYWISMYSNWFSTGIAGQLLYIWILTHYGISYCSSIRTGRRSALCH